MHSDFIIIGSGIAGLNFALNSASKGKVLIITKKKIISSSTNLAQGGIAAVIKYTDSFQKHIRDTLIAGHHHNKKQAVKFMIHNAPKAIKRLLDFGVRFDGHQGKIDLGLEGGHSERRIIHAGDYTGKEIESRLVKHAQKHPNITIWENAFTLDLLVKNNICYGVQVIKNKSVKNVFCQHVTLATGGLGQVYLHTTNPEIATGDGFAMAFRAGAKLNDMEFVQFHPTALNRPGKYKFLLSEALRGEGAILVNYQKKQFMKKYHPLGDLAPRDIVSKAIYQEEKNGPIYLKMKKTSPEKIILRFPQIYEQLLKHGFELTKDYIPVTPAAHYICGGIKINLQGKTSIKNLYAFGEVAWTGVHGANRLASNSLLEALVFSGQITKKLTKSANTKHPHFPLPKYSNQPDQFSKIQQEIKKTMWDKVGIVKTNQGLHEAKKTLVQLQKHLQKTSNRYTNEAKATTENLLTCALLITRAALKRKKSLGTHYIQNPQKPE